MSRAYPTKTLKRAIRRSLAARGEGPLPWKVNTLKALAGRDRHAAEWPDFERRRAHATERRQEALENLDALHARLRERWAENGVTVHEAADAAAAREIILGIARRAGVSSVVKGKSMLGEEIAINAALEEAGIEPVETDLGEYIVQLRGEPPSHITMPGMHLDRRDVGRLFADELGVEYTENPSELTQIARRTLRERFLAAGMGMVGVNFAVAETGHLATVTNEGNGRMVSSLPRVVVALMGWERVTETLDDLALLWQLLARSATGQRATVYLNLTHGPAPGPAGPDEVHVVVVDNGRRRVREDGELSEVLRCIRCGACLNACPVYQQVGGHPYGGTYPGPIGKVVGPALLGLEETPDHPFASTLCGACEEICPVSIPLPKMLLALRRRQVEGRGVFDLERTGWVAFRHTASDRRRWEVTTLLGRGIAGLWPAGVPGWSVRRATPSPAKQPFRARFRDEEAE